MDMPFIYTREKNAVFYMHKLLLYEGGTEKRQSFDLSRQIPIMSTETETDVHSEAVGLGVASNR